MDQLFPWFYLIPQPRLLNHPPLHPLFPPPRPSLHKRCLGNEIRMKHLSRCAFFFPPRRRSWCSRSAVRGGTGASRCSTTSPPPSTRRTSALSSTPSRTPYCRRTSKTSCCSDLSPYGGSLPPSPQQHNCERAAADTHTHTHLQDAAAASCVDTDLWSSPIPNLWSHQVTLDRPKL